MHACTEISEQQSRSTEACEIQDDTGRCASLSTRVFVGLKNIQLVDRDSLHYHMSLTPFSARGYVDGFLVDVANLFSCSRAFKWQW